MKNQLLYKMMSRFYFGDIYSALFLNRAHCVILAYHKTSPLQKDCLSPEMVVEPDAFEDQIKYLRENYEIIALADIENFFRKNKDKKNRAAVITFDDGYEDNYIYAMPILQKYGVPATIFVPTAFIETKKVFWWDLLDFILRKTDLTHMNFKYDSMECVFKLDKKNKREAFRRMRSLLKYADPSSRERLLGIISDSLQVDAGGFHSAVLTWKQMKEMQNNNISFGAHTHNHQRLIGLSEDGIKEELFHPKERLESALGQKIDDFAYPYGAESDINVKAKDMLNLAGYKRGLTMSQGQVFMDSDIFYLRRIGVGGYDSMDTFKLKLKGAIPLLKG